MTDCAVSQPPDLVVTLRARLPWHARLLLPFILLVGRFPRFIVEASHDDGKTWGRIQIVPREND